MVKDGRSFVNRFLWGDFFAETRAGKGFGGRIGGLLRRYGEGQGKGRGGRKGGEMGGKKERWAERGKIVKYLSNKLFFLGIFSGNKRFVFSHLRNISGNMRIGFSHLRNLSGDLRLGFFHL